MKIFRIRYLPEGNDFYDGQRTANIIANSLNEACAHISKVVGKISVEECNKGEQIHAITNEVLSELNKN